MHVEKIGRSRWRAMVQTTRTEVEEHVRTTNLKTGAPLKKPVSVHIERTVTQMVPLIVKRRKTARKLSRRHNPLIHVHR